MKKQMKSVMVVTDSEFFDYRKNARPDTIFQHIRGLRGAAGDDKCHVVFVVPDITFGSVLVAVTLAAKRIVDELDGVNQVAIRYFNVDRNDSGTCWYTDESVVRGSGNDGDRLTISIMAPQYATMPWAMKDLYTDIGFSATVDELEIDMDVEDLPWSIQTFEEVLALWHDFPPADNTVAGVILVKRDDATGRLRYETHVPGQPLG